ncbi:peptidoglycan recognition protein 1-like [Discoglossus pictus]
MFWLVVVLSASFAASQGCPSILYKEQWGGKIVSCHNELSTPVDTVIIHHTAGEFCMSKTVCSTQAKSIQGTHIRARGWCDIGYNFLIGEDGQIYEGRGWNATGAHAPGYNHRSIGISFMGTFTDRVPNSAAQNAAKKLIRCGVSKGYIKSTYILKGHRDVTSTQCPGNRFYKTIKKWRNFEA